MSTRKTNITRPAPNSLGKSLSTSHHTGTMTQSSGNQGSQSAGAPSGNKGGSGGTQSGGDKGTGKS